jgi:hypothetical protein
VGEKKIFMDGVLGQYKTSAVTQSTPFSGVWIPSDSAHVKFWQMAPSGCCT